MNYLKKADTEFIVEKSLLRWWCLVRFASVEGFFQFPVKQALHV